MRYVDRWDPEQPWSLHRRFVKVIREVAQSSAGRVGETVTVTSLPRVAVPIDVGMTMFIGPPDRELYRTWEISRTYGVDGSMQMYAPARISEDISMGGMTMAVGEDVDGVFGPLEGFLRNPPST